MLCAFDVHMLFQSHHFKLKVVDMLFFLVMYVNFSQAEWQISEITGILIQKLSLSHLIEL